MNNEKLIWHYTRLSLLPLIEESGALIPKSEVDEYKKFLEPGRNLSQTPFIWFSSDQHYERLCVNIGAGNRERFLTTQEILHRNKAIRFGILASDSRMLNWEQTCKAGGSNREERRRRKELSVKARKLGSNCSGWFTSTTAIPLTDLHFQVWYRGDWCDYDL